MRTVTVEHIFDMITCLDPDDPLGLTADEFRRFCEAHNLPASTGIVQVSAAGMVTHRHHIVIIPDNWMTLWPPPTIV